MIKLLFMFERRKQICSGHKGQFDKACAQINVSLIKYNQYKIMAEV